jgi:hypothetical protein
MTTAGGETSRMPLGVMVRVMASPVSGLVDRTIVSVVLSSGAIRNGSSAHQAVTVARRCAPHAACRTGQRRYPDHDLVFCDHAGLPMRPGSVTTAFESYGRACGLPVIRLHDTRDAACPLLLAGGVPIGIVQMILGHSSLEVTHKGLRPSDAQGRRRAGRDRYRTPDQTPPPDIEH